MTWAAFAIIGLPLVGCRVAAPIHVWEPPTLQSTVGKRVVLQGVFGPEESADPIKEKLLASVPNDPGRSFTLTEPETLDQGSQVRQASATDQEISDVMLASDAKRQGIDFLLRGEIITDRRQTPLTQASTGPAAVRGQRTMATSIPPTPNQGSSGNGSAGDGSAGDGSAGDGSAGDGSAGDGSPDEDNPRIVLSWRLTEIGQSPSSAGQPLVIDYQSALKRYPDLARLADTNEVLTTAAARETYGLIAPSVQQQRVALAKPFATPGAAEVRRGNAAAVAGRWLEAEQIWRDTWQKHPLQAAAVHNLALAAVAGQDFSRAKELARRAIRMRPTRQHQQTLAWVELRQRDYHQSFNLADPPEGWFVTHQDESP